MADTQTVLLVEDDPNDVLLIRRAFEKLGNNIQLVDVGDGEQAIRYLVGDGQYADRQKYPNPQLMLLDLKLPRKSGFEVLAWLADQATGKPRLTVVVLTSSKQAGDIERAYQLGANSYLVKPVSFEDLLKMVEIFKSYWLSINQWPPRDSLGSSSGL